MTTWICRAVGLCLASGLLAGCEDVTSAFGGSSAVAVSQARMAFGAVTLKPPAGYCIDAKSLKQNFALMARCDALGAPSAAGSAPRGIITASFALAGATIPTPGQTAEALTLQDVTDAAQSEAKVTFRARGATPAEGLSPSHWRGTAQVGTQVMSLAFFGPEGGAATTAQGRGLLDEVIAESRAGS